MTYVTYVIRVSPSTCSSSQSDSFSGTPYPIAHYVSYNKFSAQHRYFLGAITVGYEPTSYTETFQNAWWREAMRTKILALEKNGIWTIKALPPEK